MTAARSHHCVNFLIVEASDNLSFVLSPEITISAAAVVEATVMYVRREYVRVFIAAYIMWTMVCNRLGFISTKREEKGQKWGF